jgi:hypothetical protein
LSTKVADEKKRKEWKSGPSITREIFNMSMTGGKWGGRHRLEEAVMPIVALENEVELFNELSHEEQRTYGVNHFDLWWTDIPHVDRAFIKEWELAEDDFSDTDEGYWDRI